MQKQKQEKVLLKCIVKDCNSKVLVTLKVIEAKDSAIQFFNMFYFHKKQRNFTFIGNNLYTFSFLKTIIRY